MCTFIKKNFASPLMIEIYSLLNYKQFYYIDILATYKNFQLHIGVVIFKITAITAKP